MPSTYIITESSPKTTTYIRAGRGGAGNIRAHTSSAPSSSHTQAPSRHILSASSLASSARRFYSGIGGAGNAHAADERPPLNLDDDFRRAAARDNATRVCHTGIGGAGNVFRRKASDASSVDSDADSVCTTKSQMMDFSSRR
jgi:hypothetical protein